MLRFVRLLCEPAEPVSVPYIKIRNIGFDIQDGRPIKDIDVFHMNGTSLHFFQFEDGQTDGIGPSWGRE